MKGANLSRADFASASPIFTDLADADLTGSILVYTDLTQARMFGADLTNVSFATANLTGADLMDAKVTREQPEDCRRLEGVIMPDGLRYEAWIERDRQQRTPSG